MAAVNRFSATCNRSAQISRALFAGPGSNRWRLLLCFSAARAYSIKIRGNRARATAFGAFNKQPASERKKTRTLKTANWSRDAIINIMHMDAVGRVVGDCSNRLECLRNVVGPRHTPSRVSPRHQQSGYNVHIAARVRESSMISIHGCRFLMSRRPE